MKITHICLCGPVTDGWSYQDNILPKYHVKLGYKVTCITSWWIYNSSGVVKICKKSRYYNEHGVKVIRLPAKYNANINTKIKLFNNVYEIIDEEKPEIIFVHGCQFINIRCVVKYVKKNKNVKVFVDNHADFSNSAKNFLSKNLLHKVIWKYCANKINPYTNKFYGVLPARVEFLKNMYGLQNEKVQLLVMGADDDKIDFKNKDIIRKDLRKKYNIDNDDFLIITGGKIDHAKKQTLLLMEAVKEIKRKKIRLLVFGSVIENLKEQVLKLSDGVAIQYIGWLESDEVYNYFFASDLAVFLGRHSVLWEQAVGIGMPCVFKYWNGTTHVDIGGNCRFIYSDTINEIKELLINIITKEDIYNNMKYIAEIKGKDTFSYSKIAKKSIEID